MINMKTIFVLFSVLLLAYSCERDHGNRDFEDDPSIQNISGTWVVRSYEDYTFNNPVIRKSDVDSWNGMDVILSFTSDSFYGRNTTNDVSGNFKISGRTIHVTSYGGSKVGQPQWGNMFSDIVYDLESFKMNRNQLRFFYNENKNSVTLVPN